MTGKGTNHLSHEFDYEWDRRNQRKYSYYDYYFHIPTFDGNLITDGIFEWVDEIDEFLELFYVNPSKEAEFVAKKLRGKAETCWKELHHN